MNQSTIVLSIEGFGSLKDFIEKPISLTLSNGENVRNVFQQVENILVKSYPSQTKLISSILRESVLATKERILDFEEIFTRSYSLAILPPVCGG